jgi:hypothetical protein
MPNTYRELISQIRLNLLEPHPNHPSEPVIWTHLRQNARRLFNQALNTPVSWAIEWHVLDVNENDDLYLLPAQNFGKDVLVEPIDVSDPNFVGRPVRRMSLQSSLLGGNTPYTSDYGYLNMLGEKHSANTFVFIRDSAAGNVRIRVYPKPHMAAQYKIWYETSEPNTTALDNFFPILAGQDLLCLSTAFSCLPGAEWSDMSREESADKRKELGVTLGSDVKGHADEYKRYIATDRNQGLSVLRGFQDSEYMDG